MPKMPPRDNRRNRNSRTIQGAAEGMASLLQRMSRRSDVILSTATGSNTGASHIARSAHAADSPAVTESSPATAMDMVRAALPEGLRPHVLDCLLRPGELVLFTDAAAWATRVRMAACEAASSGAFSALPGVTTGTPKITVRVAAAPTR